MTGMLVKRLPHLLATIILFLISACVQAGSVQEQNWGLHSTQTEGHIQFEEARKKFGLKRKIVVAIIDTGIDPEHPYLKDNIHTAEGTVSANNYGMDFSSKNKANTAPIDHHGHGTHVAGIVRGVFPEVRILAIKYFNPNASGPENLAATIKALEYAVKMNVDIINYSGGGPEPSVEELKVLKEAEKKGILVVAAAGNEHSDIDQKQNAYYPASYRLSNIITVTAHNQNLEVLPSSNWGKSSVDISAPGYQIRSSLPQGRMGLMTGTSQATAFVSGVAALLKAQDPSLDASATRKIIISSARKFASFKGKCIAEGILSASHSLDHAQRMISSLNTQSKP